MTPTEWLTRFQAFVRERRRRARAARVALNNAVRDGRVRRGNVCERCGWWRTIEAHHPDYARPLDVEWLCHGCHREEHAAGAPLAREFEASL